LFVRSLSPSGWAWLTNKKVNVNSKFNYANTEGARPQAERLRPAGREVSEYITTFEA